MTDLYTPLPEVAKTTSLAEMWDKLSSHDWFYYMSDDHRSYTRGRDQRRVIDAMAKESPAHQALLDEFLSGKTPERPVE
jgi:hypothetical protein